MQIYDEKVTVSTHQLTKLDQQILSLNQALVERDKQIAILNQAVAKQEALRIQVEQQERLIAELKTELQRMLTSKSWRITRPLREARQMIDDWTFPAYRHSAINALSIARQQLRTHGTAGFLRRIPYYLRKLRHRPDLLLRAVHTHAPEFFPGSSMRHEVRMHPELQSQMSLHPTIKVSVVIPTLNAGPEFSWLLQKLFGQKGIGTIEIVIVDSGSKDSTVTIAKETGCVVVEILPTEFSHSYARNRGAKEATGDYLLFMVQDAYPIGDYWMAGILQFLQDYAHEKLVAASCAEYSRSDSDVMYDSMIHTHYQFLGCLHYDRIGEFKEQGHFSVRSQGQLSDIACMIERSVFQRYRYRGDYAEDLELGTRLIQDGHRVAMLASIKVIHSHNRPVFYYFKRSFVDVIFLVNLFPDFEYSHIESQNGLFAGILSTATLLARWLQTPLPPEQTDTRDILRRFHDECRRQFIPTRKNEDAHLDNGRLDDWLAQLRQHQDKAGLSQHTSDASVLQEARRFLDAFLGRVDHFSRFVEQIYGPCTDTLSLELRQAIVKIYGATVGSALAFMFLDITHQRCQGDLEHAQAIYEELKAGI
ncbi:glycosyltransferase [Nitrosomonas sp.]|uniref:glycosyltransferase n=1 Tax=Nitrosomonas sp. TaxID=42353 RepID=UPI0037C62083